MATPGLGAVSISKMVGHTAGSSPFGSRDGLAPLCSRPSTVDLIEPGNEPAGAEGREAENRLSTVSWQEGKR